MRSLFMIAAPVAAGALMAGCSSDRPALTRLDCPATEGDLTRVSTTPNGHACVYRGPQGEDVALRLLPVLHNPQATLTEVERELRSALPAPKTTERQAAAATDDDAPAKVAVPEVIADDETAQVHLPGVHIVAKDDDAHVHVRGMHIDAGESGVALRMLRDVRMRGEALAREKRGVRGMLLLAGDQAGPGYSYVGYEASGPRTGPLAVAVIKAKAGDHDTIHGDVERLVRRNGGA